MNTYNYERIYVFLININMKRRIAHTKTKPTWPLFLPRNPTYICAHDQKMVILFISHFLVLPEDYHEDYHDIFILDDTNPNSAYQMHNKIDIIPGLTIILYDSLWCEKKLIFLDIIPPQPTWNNGENKNLEFHDTKERLNSDTSFSIQIPRIFQNIGEHSGWKRQHGRYWFLLD